MKQHVDAPTETFSDQLVAVSPHLDDAVFGCGALLVMFCLLGIAWQIFVRVMYSV